MDQSSCCFNLVCMNPVTSGWLIRSAYGIPHAQGSDCFNTLLCPSCVANQAYQTTQKRGNPSIDGGRKFNKTQIDPFGSPPCYFCYACFCTRCMIASALNKYVNMNWWDGFCCVNSYAAVNILQYHYRIVDFPVCPAYCCYFSFCNICYLASIIYYVDKVGKTSDRYLVRPMSNRINPAAAELITQQPTVPPVDRVDIPLGKIYVRSVKLSENITCICL